MFRTIVLAILFVTYGIPLLLALFGWLFFTKEGLTTIGVVIGGFILLCMFF